MRLQQKNHIANFRFASQMWATRPHLASIFEKLLDQKTFCCLRLIIQNHDSFDLLLDFCCSFICKSNLLRKCGLLAHTSAAFLKNCCTEKLFICLRLVIENEFDFLFLTKTAAGFSNCCFFDNFLQFLMLCMFQQQLPEQHGIHNIQNMVCIQICSTALFCDQRSLPNQILLQHDQIR